MPSSPLVSRVSRPRGETIVSVQNVSKTYKLGKQTITALRDVTFTIGKGEFVAVTGASGSGKSTLLQIIGCLDKPTAGKVAVESRETTNLSSAISSSRRQSCCACNVHE